MSLVASTAVIKENGAALEPKWFCLSRCPRVVSKPVAQSATYVCHYGSVDRRAEPTRAERVDNHRADRTLTGPGRALIQTDTDPKTQRYFDTSPP